MKPTTVKRVRLLALGGMAAFAAWLVAESFASAYINPNFTPLDLMKQSELVLLLDFKAPEKGKGISQGVIKKVLKGKFEDKEVPVDFLAMPEAIQAQGQEMIGAIGSGDSMAMFFKGTFEADGAGIDGRQEMGFIHIAGRWIFLSQDPNNKKLWNMDKIEAQMNGTWSGGTDMLLRCIEYIVRDPAAEVPIREGVVWGEKVGPVKMGGKVYGARAVDLSGDGKLTLYVASEGGDKLIRYDGKGFTDLTAKLGLSTKSKLSAWADFTGDGKVDLVSWTGTELMLAAQKADGTFEAPKAVATGDALKGGCASLAVVDSATLGQPALVAGLKGWPVLLTIKGATAEAKALGQGAFPADLGEQGDCVVTDFDGDGWADVLQFFTQGGMLYKGTGAGQYAAGVKANVAVGRGAHGIGLGDYDGDGMMDVVTVAEDVSFLWQNNGGGKFSDTMSLSGSFAYITKPGGICTQQLDINNDGRQDLFVAYGSQMAPHIFFNRGYRSFGQARDIDLQDKDLLPAALEGQQAGSIADFTGDGGQDMALAVPNGEVWLFPRSAEGTSSLAITASLAMKGPSAGPVVVKAVRDGRCLGGWSVTAGGPPAFFGLKELGPVTIHWRYPGKEAQQKEVMVEDKSIHLTLDK